MLFQDALPYIIVGVTTVTAINTIGSVASRKLNFNYVMLAPLSLLTYILIGYYSSKAHGVSTTLYASCVIGVYEATIGLKLSSLLRANTGMDEEETKIASSPLMLLILVSITILFGFIGHLFA